ncbi:MAG: hypothetical protein ACP5M4_15805 [Acidobacteriaceae bacterium]
MQFKLQLQNIVRPMVEHRILLSFGLSAAAGIVLNSLYSINAANPLLRLMAMERPPLFHALVWSYDFFLYSTPFLLLTAIFSLTYIHLYKREQEEVSLAHDMSG